MTLQLLHSECPYIWGKFDFLFLSVCFWGMKDSHFALGFVEPVLRPCMVCILHSLCVQSLQNSPFYPTNCAGTFILFLYHCCVLSFISLRHECFHKICSGSLTQSTIGITDSFTVENTKKMCLLIWKLVNHWFVTCIFSMNAIIYDKPNN
jgi:hypothetical protein